MKFLLTALSVVDVVLLVGVLAFYLMWVTRLLNRIADNLGEVSQLVRTINGHAEPIVPGLQQVNRTLGVISGALPLLYGLAERIVGRRQPAMRAVAGGRR